MALPCRVLSSSLSMLGLLANVVVGLRSSQDTVRSRVAQRIAMKPNQRRTDAHHPPSPTQASFILTLSLPFIAVAAMVLIPSSPFKNSLSILHQVPEGRVGVYWRGGALLKTITEPGFHLKMPFITQYKLVQVTLKTNMVTGIQCGTKGGFMINFEKIEVVNRLYKEYVYETLLNYGMHYDKTWIYDKIHHEINQFCSSHNFQQVYIDVFDQIGNKMKDALHADCTRYAPGIEVISVHVTKPTIPDSIRRNFEQTEEERSKVLVVTERQKVAEKEAETAKKVAIIEAEKNANVSKILMEQKLAEKEASGRQQQLENRMHLEREKSLADAYLYRATKEAEANRLRLTPKFLVLKFIEATANNTKTSSGNKMSRLCPFLVTVFQAFPGLISSVIILCSSLSAIRCSVSGQVAQRIVMKPNKQRTDAHQPPSPTQAPSILTLLLSFIAVAAMVTFTFSLTVASAELLCICILRFVLPFCISL
ncbi:erlin-2-B-like [Neltuma alba]|uniref:erlin-2-B-like n=1 Tax=Neltuma alba TaxID=207710 RepID=UPI0010A55851|nr:erlin-2-B-like [Prosopis alba]